MEKPLNHKTCVCSTNPYINFSNFIPFTSSSLPSKEEIQDETKIRRNEIQNFFLGILYGEIDSNVEDEDKIAMAGKLS